VGFVPAIPVLINNLGPFSNAQISRNAQNLSIEYKTGAVARCLLGFTAHGLMEIPVACSRIDLAIDYDDHPGRLAM